MSTTPANSEPGCCVCGRATRCECRNLYDDRYGYPGRFELRRCRACGHHQLAARFDAEELETLYSSFYPRSSMRAEDWRPYEEVRGWRAWFTGERAYAFRWVPCGVRVLDIGCGFGEALGYHRARGCEAEGVEADDNAQRVAERHGLKISKGLFCPENYPEGYFDVVTLDQVIEHMADPVEALRGVRRVLKPGGSVILSTPNPEGWGARVFGRYWINWHVPYHLQQFCLRSMALAAERAGLRLRRSRTITSSEWLLYQWLHLASWPENGEPSAFWAGLSSQPNALRRGVAKLARAFHLLRGDHWLTRLFDALGLGDNRVYWLERA